MNALKTAVRNATPKCLRKETPAQCNLRPMPEVTKPRRDFASECLAFTFMAIVAIGVVLAWFA